VKQMASPAQIPRPAPIGLFGGNNFKRGGDSRKTADNSNLPTSFPDRSNFE
jgi:hypothetical protein